jgi:hypothetical protein
MRLRIFTAACLAALASVFSTNYVSAQTGGSGVSPTDLIGTGEVGGSYVSSGTYTPTIEEGILRGSSELARGMGDFNYLTAEAIKAIEQAKSMNVDTRMKGLENYWEAKRINYEMTLGKIQRFSTEQMAALARKEAPSRLASHQYEPFSGKLNWPIALKSRDFAEHRAMVDEMFATRTTHDVGPDTEFHATVREVTDEMEVMLQARIDRLPPMEYMTAKNFLNGLEMEAKFAPGTAGLASR